MGKVKTMMTGALLLLISTACKSTAVTPVQNISSRDEWERAGCILDRDKFCKDAGANEILSCFKNHEVELSEDCKLEIGIIKRPTQLSDPKLCDADRERLCNGRQGVSAGKCLYDNESRASDLCRQHLNERRTGRKRLQKFQEDCGQDLRLLCATVPNSEHNRYACLKRNYNQLSALCKTHVLL